ncbi:SRPBCC family protein [Constantimarinum furrinae]|uniref:Cell division inhibitor n=1 Tax=Constantimarinum furrinae TaxID=2562285 RepID=A0A7G8PW66_9FLAO|nr:SRPBCC family protein [Constantimarinum furrinae]QNJ98582.1 hypothetical protein ALE3EI_2035 [Constantimarinum furrinae]
MKIHCLSTLQELPTSPEDAWKFLSDPKNLSKITPASLKFKIKSGADKPMYPGQIIEYSVSPFPRIKSTWITEITHLKEHQYFVDEQRFGPYAFWHHKHFLRKTDRGVEMEDIIHYKLPFGFLGELFHNTLVLPQLNRIFNYRRVQLEEQFGKI